jgi:hypothetical protein
MRIVAHRRTYILTLTLLCCAGCGHLTPSPAPAPLLGRWLFTFHIMGGLFRTPVELSADSAGVLHASALGPRLVTFHSASAINNELQLEGQSRFGTVHAGGPVMNDSLIGRWRIKILRGDLSARRIRGLSNADERVKVFDSAWATVGDRYYDPRFDFARWDSLRTVYRPRAVAARNDGELQTIVREMFAELHSSHLDFLGITTADAFPDRGGETADESRVITWRSLDANTAYLRIAMFDEGPAAIARLDSAFGFIFRFRGLVIDVRGNPGGTLGVAMRLGDYLFPQPVAVGIFAKRVAHDTVVYTGYKVDEFLRVLDSVGAVMIKTGGRATPYAGRVALLIDERCGSTTEAFAAVIQELRRAVLVGQKTAGAMLSSTEVHLPADWVLRVPEADFHTPAAKRVEGVGVSPDIVASRHWYRDSQLIAARNALAR